MPDETKYGLECSEFEALLSDALDGTLSGTRKQSFENHRRACPVCGPMFADAEAGLKFLRSVPEVEPPVNLVHNILAATTGIPSERLARAPQVHKPGLAGRVREWWESFATPTVSFVRQPRFVMSFGMIFFSFSLALSAAGVKASDVAKIPVTPSAMKRTYYLAQARVVKFYENIRFVYEIESRVRDFKRATTPAEPAPQKQNNNPKNNTSGQPDERQERNYSRDENQPVLAGLPEPPAVNGATTRRYL